jgi:hypothetical protein
MTTEPGRDPAADLLTRDNAARSQPISSVSLAGELQRDWVRTDTVADVAGIVLTTRLLASS